MTNVEKEEIWSSILTGVASSKMVPTKKILLLGDLGSGKSTLVHYLKNDPGPQIIENEESTTTNNFINVKYDYAPAPNEEATNTLALGYSFIDVQDEDNEAIARLGIYQLGYSAVEYMPLLKFALSTDTLADSAVIIVLDWTRPWEFVRTLQRWVDVLQHRIDEMCKEGNVSETWSKGKAVLDELCEKLEHYLQTYTEPIPSNTATSTSMPLVTTTTAADQVALPLTQGSLTNNLGIPLIFVCCKSDHQNKLEQTLDYKDEQFDFIQQTLRCICMKYGAALFYTSTLQPYTFHNLRQYILHRLLTTATKLYPFDLKAQVVERDSVLVPSGWDSWGKVRVLREGFDCESVHQGWDLDMEAIMDRQQPTHGVRTNYEEMIPDPSSIEQPLNNVPPPITCEDEAAFLSRHFETLQNSSEYTTRKAPTSATKPSIIGPLETTPTPIDVEDRKPKDSTLDSSLKLSTSSTTTNNAVNTSVPNMDTNTNVNQAGGPSHEVLANFFQSLLVKKATSSGGSSPTLAKEDDATSSGTTKKPTVSRNDVHKELDRMRQYVKNTENSFYTK